MADSDCKPKQKATKSNKKKRKVTTATVEEHEQQKRRSKSKAPLIEDPKDDKEESQTRKLELQGSSPWRNLQLVLSLQNKHVQLPIKVELAHEYVNSELGKEVDDTSQEKETVSISRVIVFLNNWVQSLLISSEKEIRAEGLSGNARSCLDYKCWEIFKFCLVESLKWHVSLSFSRDFLRVINCIARDILSELTAASAHPEARNLGGEKLELYTTVLNCISVVFSCHEGISNENLDLWVLTVESVLELVQKVVVDKLIGDKAGIFAMQFSCAVLEPFTKFLRVHPARKDGFRGFISKLLEPLMQLMDLLRLYGSNPGWTRNFLKLVEDVLSLGLFHSVHIDGFTSLQSIKKYKTSDEGKVKDFNMVVKSYHRHLFDKLEKIMAGKNALSLGGVGELFRLYVDCVKEHKGVLVRAGGCGNHLEDDLTRHVFKNSIGSNGVDTGKRHCSSGLNAETRKSVFDFFVQIMEPLLLEMDAYLQADLQVGPMLLDVHCTLKSVNKLLGCFMRENIYIRTDDSTEGACVNFLMIFYDKLMSFSASMSQLIPKNCGLERGTNKESLSVIAKELIISLRYLMDIEYKILGNDLESLWLMMFSYGALGFSLVDLPDQSLISETIGFGCQLVNLYSELRQVSNSLFALCKAVRCLVTGYSRILSCTPSYNASYAQSLRMVLCSQEFRIAISSAIKSIPEGQATGCIRQLATDISESLDWMKGNCSIAAEKGQIDLQAELLGRGLSEVYTLILDSLTVTTGNSSSVGVSLKGLVAVIRPIMSGLVGLQEDPLYEFMSIFMGSTFSKKAGKRTEVYSQWAVLLFFRLYLSSRSLQRQIISLVPPDTSRELSGVMHDSFTAYSARDWLESAGGGDESYFSWIVQPSTSLLSVLQAVSNIFIADTFASCSPLVYVLNAMALQRLVDLNKLIKSFEYLLQRNDNLILSKLTDDTGSSLRRKRSRKWRRCVSDLRQEAEGLTEFIMGYLPLVAKDHLCISSTVGARQWDFGISSMNEKSLPSAIWWIICQNVDIWSRYAANKKLKKFLSLLIQNSLPNTISSTNRPDSEKTVSVHQISVDLLSDAVLYEQRFARRHMASRFCRLLEKTVSATSGNAGKVDLSSPPNWSEVLNALTNRSITVSDNNDVLHDGSCGTEQITNSFKKIDMKPCMEQKFFPSVIVEFTSCQNLLNFLSWMPKGYLTSQSITIYITCILNLERSVVGSLLDCQGAICSPDHRELFRLLMSCRRALKNLLMAVSEERMEARKSSHASTVFRSSFSVLWLLKSLSAVIELQHACTEDGPTSQVKDMTFSLIDHTSYVFLTLSRDRFLHAIRFLKYTGEKPNVPVFHKKGDLTKVDPCSISSEDSIDAWEGVFQLAETLREQTQKLLIPLEEVQVSDGIHGCKKLSSVISCFQGFLWGLSSALSQLDAEIRDLEIKSFTCKFEPVCKVNLCIDTFAKFVSNFLCGLFLDDFTLPQSLSEAQALPLLESTGNFVGVKDSSPEGPPDVRDNSSKRVRRKRFRSDNAFPDDIFAKVELFDQQCIKMALLRSFLGGENLEAAVFLRQLFIASSAILRLNLHFNSTSFSSGLVPIFIGISECLLLAFVDKVEVPQPFSFVWMDGIVMFLEELGNHFALMNPNLSRNLYVKMVDLHLTAIGKCIALQGKGATLASHETDSSTMTLGGEMKLSESTLSHGVYCLNEFKARLRRSCTVYIKKPSELHLLSAVQAIERALVGVSDGCTMNYDICTGGSDGGKVSKIVAAGIDCLDLVLEFVEGRKRLSVVGRHIQSLVACLFNIILHLQGPKIFFHNVSLSRGDADPDPGSITLMCVEVLTRVCGKHAFFQWDACYVAESLRMPAALFQNFLELGISDAATKSNSLKFSEIFDRQFSMDLYAACCRLLYTVLKHHKRESQQCIALLEDSVSVLLHCLETVDIDQAVGKGHPTWQVQGGVKCACSLRRIYEEIRQQKDALGQHSFQFLSSYIWIYSGYGPLRSGIRREIDEALRPGVYALIDACSPDDLQHIHTVFGEGPCRSTLAALQHDYKQNFQYEGKV